MAAAKKTENKVYTVQVATNPGFCGVDVAGVQFAYGEAQVTDPWIAEWYRTHDGYKVTESGATAEEPAAK